MFLPNSLKRHVCMSVSGVCVCVCWKDPFIYQPPIFPHSNSIIVYSAQGGKGTPFMICM